MNLLKSYILSCRHFGKEIHFLLPLTFTSLFQPQAAPPTAMCPAACVCPERPWTVSLASLKGWWTPRYLFPPRQVIFISLTDGPGSYAESLTVVWLWFYNIFNAKAVQACKKSNQRELYKEQFNSLPIFFLPITASSSRSFGNDLAHFPCTYIKACMGACVITPSLLRPKNEMISHTWYWNSLLFIKAYKMSTTLVDTRTSKGIFLKNSFIKI